MHKHVKVALWIMGVSLVAIIGAAYNERQAQRREYPEYLQKLLESAKTERERALLVQSYEALKRAAQEPVKGDRYGIEVVRRGAKAAYLRDSRISTDPVVVWGGPESDREFEKLGAAGLHETRPDLLVPHLRCRVPAGTRVAILAGHIRTSLVVIGDGDKAGCRGYVLTRDLYLPEEGG